jgi:arabinofuranosyltransferase
MSDTYGVAEAALPTRDIDVGIGAPESPVDRRLPRWWPVLVPVIIVLIGAWLYRWVDEDAFIDFRIIDNLLAGHGLVYNLGERVEVDSDPLWIFTLAGLHEVLPFMALEWLSVALGLVCTAGGFLTGARAAQRLGYSRDETTAFPLGLLMVSVVAGVWEFATSGLEMSMVFLWLGVSFLALVGVERRRVRAWPTGLIIGLGTLIRPELLLVSIVFLVGLLVVVTAPGWSTDVGRFRRALPPILAAVALPVLYEIFRMGYYALLVPNTGLAKAGGSAWWTQGFTYLWNFVAPYTLWLPLLLAVPFLVSRASTWWTTGDRLGVVVLMTPFVAGWVDVLYVVYVGGDYMHARLLLPGFFAICLPIFVSARQVRSLLAVPLVGIAVWGVVCLGWLRFVPPKVTSLNPQTVFISNERNSWISATKNSHPVTAADYGQALSGEAGTLFRSLARRLPPGRQELLVITNTFGPINPSTAQPASSPLPFKLAVNVPAIGVIGYVAGPQVYVFDEFSLANPVGSHTTVTKHARPGHEKFIGPAWMVARFGTGSWTPGPGEPSRSSVDSARTALGCEPLRSYLHAITAPLTWSQSLSNFGHAVQFTTMSFSADPLVAATQLCPPASSSTSATRP